jgi:proliferating cell nuclear antigen
VVTLAIDSDRIAEYEMKLMDIDTDQLGIPDTEYDATVSMSSTEFGRIVRDLSQLGESVKIEITKEGVRFASEGETANGNVLLKQTGGAPIGKVQQIKQEQDEGGSNLNGDAEDEDDGGVKVKKEKKEQKIKKEKGEDGEDVEMDEEDVDNENFEPESEAEDQAGSDDEREGKKRKKVCYTP